MRRQAKCQNTKKKLKVRKGLALPITVSILMILMTISAGFMMLSYQAELQSIRTTKEIMARSAADAGLTTAVYQMNQLIEQQSFDQENLPQATNVDMLGSDSKYSYSVVEEDGNYYIQSVGNAGWIQKDVRAALEVQSGLFKDSFFGENGLFIKNNAYIDGYNSDLGPYGDSNKCSINLGTNSTEDGAIEINNNAYVDGDVFVGPDGDVQDVVNLGNNADVTGELYASGNQKELVLITAPDLPYIGEMASGAINTSGTYNKIDLSNNELLTINGNVTLYITEDVKVGNNAAIQISENSMLKLYVGKDFEVSNNGTINNYTQTPSNCQVFSTADQSVSFNWQNNSDFYGTVYAPKAHIEVKNNAEFYGALVGEYVKIDNNAGVHGDLALLKADITDPQAQFVITRWSE